MREQGFAAVIRGLHILFTEHIVDVIVAGPTDPQNAGAHVLTAKQTLVALLAMPGARHQVVTGKDLDQSTT